MSLQRVAGETIQPTQPIVIEGRGPGRPFMCVFEDDGICGYFYALDLRKRDVPIVDAVQVYQYTDGNEDQTQYELEILWQADHDRCVLSIDGYPYALFDFETKTGYNETGFPEPDSHNGWRRVGSTDQIMSLLRDMPNSH